MPDRWFRTREREEEGPLGEVWCHPDLAGEEDNVRGWSGTRAADASPTRWIVRVYADEETLEAIGNGAGIQIIGETADDALDGRFGTDNSPEDWNDVFRIELI